VGEAGVGKSRLTYEFTHSHRVEDWLILEASSVSRRSVVTSRPVVIPAVCAPLALKAVRSTASGHSLSSDDLHHSVLASVSNGAA
jgi:hypothetical protein